MASTRNKNTKSDYLVEKEDNKRYIDYINYLHSSSGPAIDPKIPNGGSAPPSRLSRDYLCGNAIDVESRLRGIGSTNLVIPQDKIIPKINKHENISFFDRGYTVIPDPLIVEENQRARPIP